MPLVPSQQQRHGVQHSQQHRSCWSLPSLAGGEDGFIFGKHPLGSIVLAYPCHRSMLGTPPCLMLGLHNLPAALVLTREHDLPFEEQGCPASWELWQTGPGRIVNSLPPTQRAGHEQTPKAPVEESERNKKETTAQGPWELPATPKGRGSGRCRHRRAFLESVPSIPTLGSEQSVWQSVWALPLAAGLAGGGNCRRNKSLFQSGPGSLPSTGTKRGMQR